MKTVKILAFVSTFASVSYAQQYSIRLWSHNTPPGNDTADISFEDSLFQPSVYGATGLEEIGSGLTQTFVGGGDIASYSGIAGTYANSVAGNDYVQWSFTTSVSYLDPRIVMLQNNEYSDSYFGGDFSLLNSLSATYLLSTIQNDYVGAITLGTNVTAPLPGVDNDGGEVLDFADINLSPNTTYYVRAYLFGAGADGEAIFDDPGFHLQAFTQVPEPSVSLLFGLVGFCVLARRKR
jgi:hypothetical protein